jgi:serine/threonine protein kinase
MNSGRTKLGERIAERYEVIEILHRGDFNSVYLCREPGFEGCRVIKEIWGGEAPAEERNLSKELFEREVSILESLNHPGIPRFTENFALNEWHYMVMEFIDGITLRKMLQMKAGPVESGDAARWAIKLCQILHYLHDRSDPIIFKDLCPAHIMLSRTDSIKLIDFGLARIFNKTKGKDTYVLGTFGFAAPEQYGKGQTSPRTDIYSLGATLYELLTYLEPQQFLFEFPPVRKFNKGVPHWLDGIILKCLERTPRNRFKNALALQKELEKGSQKQGY